MIYVLIFCLAVILFSLSAISGGGAGLVLIPLIGLALPVAQVPAALSIGTATSALSRAIVFRTRIRWDVVRLFVPAALPAAAAGAWLLALAQPLWIELVLGMFLVVNGAFLFRSGRDIEGAMLSRPVLVAVGAAAGLLSGLTGAVGVVFNKVYMRCGLRKEEVVATRGANEVLLHISKIALYAGFGLVGWPSVTVGLVIALAAILASLAARPLLRLVSEPLFRRINYATMGVAGMAMLMGSGGALAAKYELSLSGHVHDRTLEASLHHRDRTISVEWALGGLPQIEQTLDLAQVPHDIRKEADLIRQTGATGPVRFEKVNRFDGVSYEIHVGDFERHLVITD